MKDQYEERMCLGQDEIQISIHFSSSPAHYHLINVIVGSRNACIQIKNTLSREEVAKMAAHIAGLGAI